jgi:spore coat protein A
MLALSAAVAHADTVSINPVRDATLYQPDSPSSPDDYFANGAGAYLFTGYTNNSLARRTVIAFDIVAAGIPSGSTIDSVQLTMRVTRVPESVNTSVSLHRLTSDWGEGTSNAPSEEGEGTTPTTGSATWRHTFWPDSDWTALGGDFIAGASAAVNIAGVGSYTWGSTAGMVADVQQWLDTPAGNFGWIVIGDEVTQKSAKRFNSRENGSSTTRPVLDVNYTPPQPVGSCCTTGAVCQVVTALECVALGGDYGGDGTSCSPSPCEAPLGACCFDDASCADVTQTDCEAGGGLFQSVGTSCTALQCPLVLTPWLDPLPLPAVATPTAGSAGAAASYDIAIRETTQQLHSQLPATVVWGYDDGMGASYPGPTIEARTDMAVDVNWINDLRVGGTGGPMRTDHYLDVDTACIHGAADLPKVVVHLHGGHVSAENDGYPEHTFLPGAMDNYDYPNQQQAGTLWYHDHALGITRLNVYMGLAAYYILRDDVEDARNLPSGAFEVPLAIQDRQFNPDGSFYYPSVWEQHFFGDKALVNGKVWPYLNVTRGKYRFRVLNGSGSRTYALSLAPPSGSLDFTVIGTEGGLLEAPVPGLGELTIGPGERYDVVVDFESFSPGDEILLQNSAPAPYPNGTVDLTDIMKFIVVAGPGHTDALPASLRPVVPIDPGEAVIERDFMLRKASDDGCGRQNWLINGLGWDDITEYPELGTVEIWRFINDSGVAHPMHMHLVMFQILNRQDFTIGSGGEIIPEGVPQPPAPWEAGWKDTAMVNPGEMVRVIARFEDYPGKFAYHCHILEHEDHEMMRQFQTIVPGCTVTGDDESFCDGIDNDCDGLVDEDTVCVDTDGDGVPDEVDADDDNDGVPDVLDVARLDPDVCQDADVDTCDDCAVGTDNFGPLPDNDPANDGTDTDGDGQCNAGDTDDDNDGVSDLLDSDPANPDICQDTDVDSCDDCAVGTDNFGPLPDNDPANDGTDTDGDGQCNTGDADDDNDGVPDIADSNTVNPDICQDADSDSCDDCAVGTDNFGPLPDNDPANDGTDTDGDGQCNAGDTDDDNDGVPDIADSNTLNPDVCEDLDVDSCDDCAIGTDNFGPLPDNDPANDGTDTDGDGQCNAGDDDDDNDGVPDIADWDTLNPDVLPDNDPANDGPDEDGDGICDPGEDDIFQHGFEDPPVP